MKKLLFTAITMVAFSSASMANTNETKKEEKKEARRADDCTMWAVEQVNIDEQEFGCMTATQYTQALNAYIKKCNTH